MQTHPTHTPAPAPLPADAVTRSMNEALGVSFRILHYVMLALAVVFLFSGWFNVREGEVAVRTRLGRLLGEPGEQVLDPGGPYFAWPAPLDEVVRVPTVVQRLSIDRTFWFDQPPQDQGKPIDQLAPGGGGLVPAKDGSLLTGDQNLVHGKWTALYQIRREDAADFVQNVSTLEHADRIVRFATEQAIVGITASTSADDFVRGQIDRSAARRFLQRTLDSLHSGITVTELLLSQPTPPLAVRQAFLEVSQAESEKAEKIEAAEREWSRIHKEVAGAACEALVLAIDEYEQARREGDVQHTALLERVIDEMLEGQPLREAMGPWLAAEADPHLRRQIVALAGDDRVSGTASQIIHQARSYRTQVVTRIKAEADRFTRLLPKYQEHPRLVLDRLWSDARQAILSGDVETIYLPDDQTKTLLLEFNPDPAVRRRREQEQYKLRVEGNR